MIQKFENSEAYQKVISEKVRNVDVIANLIKGVHDSDLLTRKQASQRIANIIKNPGKSKVMRLLEKFDNCMKVLRKGISLRDTQKMAIMYAIESNSNLLSQVNTGEGKSYIVAAIAIIRASQFQSVDIITSSPVLAQRDSAEMKDLYEAMSINIDHNCHEDVEKRKQAYKANVVYGEIGRFQRDYLLHHFYRKNILGDRSRENSCVIVDEVDNMLLDNGNNMLYLSHSVPGMEMLEPLFVHLERMIFIPTCKGNKEKTFATETIEASVLSDLLGRLSMDDIELMANTSEAKTKCFAVWTHLIHEQIIDSEGYLLLEKDSDFEVIRLQISSALKNLTTEIHAKKIITCLKAIVNRRREIFVPRYLIPFIRRHLSDYIENAKRALFMKSNEAYVVDVDHTQQDSDITPKVTIIDQNTGVDLATSQWSEGLHQCVQIKHGCRVNPISMKAVFVSNVNYLKGYSRINGLSGTLGSHEESRTLVDLYQADLIKVPTFRAKRLYEHVPVIAKDEGEWLDAIFEEVADQLEILKMD
uniref:Chloroplast protein-transporting ATPase n=1 Tax=Panagrolaimus superbus TaxID=310955 RepID=A0A914YDX3_9BILA